MTTLVFSLHALQSIIGCGSCQIIHIIGKLKKSILQKITCQGLHRRGHHGRGHHGRGHHGRGHHERGHHGRGHHGRGHHGTGHRVLSYLNIAFTKLAKLYYTLSRILNITSFFIYTTFILRSIHKTMCSNALLTEE